MKEAIVGDVYMHEGLKCHTVWAHTNGNRYEIIGFANLLEPARDAYPATVIYRNINNGNIFTRPVSDWHRSFLPEN